MKKIVHLLILAVLFNFLNSCGYSPIFKTENLKFHVVEYSLDGNEKVGNKILSNIKRYSDESDANAEKLSFLINSSQKKEAISKDSSGKILEYKITLKVSFQIINLTANNASFNNNIVQSTNFTVREQYSETLNSEKKAFNNLIQKISQEIFLSISQIIQT